MEQDELNPFRPTITVMLASSGMTGLGGGWSLGQRSDWVVIDTTPPTREYMELVD